jgi:transposase
VYQPTLTDKQREERHATVEAGLEAGKSVALIAAELGMSQSHVYRLRAELQVLRAKHGQERLPNARTGKAPHTLTAADEDIRAEYLRTGEIRPLARRHRMTVERLRGIIARYPSVVDERQKRLQAEAQVQQ